MNNPFVLESMEGRVLMSATVFDTTLLTATVEQPEVVAVEDDATQDLRQAVTKVEQNRAAKEQIRQAQRAFE